MSKQIYIDHSDYLRLLDVVDYAITRFEQSGDSAAVEYLKEQRGIVVRHVDNELLGDGDVTCAQIDRILGLLGGDDG